MNIHFIDSGYSYWILGATTFFCDSLYSFVGHCYIFVFLGYHKKCYQRFTNVTHIAELETKFWQLTDERHDETVAKVPRVSSRLQTDMDNQRRNKHVLPVQCIICKREKYITDRITRKRQKERLSNCEYESG